MAKFLWKTETVDGAAAAFGTSIVIDGMDRPHISYTDYSSFDLKYAVRTASSWSIAIVDSDRVAYDSSMDLDSSGQPHIAYFTFSETPWFSVSVRYATKSQGAWVVETIPDEGAYAMTLSLAMDSAGNIHIAYIGTDPETGWTAIRYATKPNGAWSVVNIARTIASMQAMTFDLDSQDRWGVCWDDEAPPCLRYTSIRPDIRFENVDCSGGLLATDVAFDSQARPRISYYYDYNAGVAVASRADTWSREFIAGTDFYQGWTALAIDAQDYPMVAYGFPSLRLATRSASGWTQETIDPRSTGDASMALDSRGRPQLSYVDGIDDPAPVLYARAVRSVLIGDEGSMMLSNPVPSLDASLARVDRLTVRPRPMLSGPLSISIDLQNTVAGATLAVFDAEGRRVRLLAGGPMASGSQALSWDGTDEQGRRAPSGVYFLRLDGGMKPLSQRIVLVR